MEAIYRELKSTAERLQKLTANVFKYNPILRTISRVSTTQLGIEARAIGECLKTVGVNLLNKEKEDGR